MFPASVYAQDDFSNSSDDTNETSEYIDNTDLSDEDIIEPDEIEEEERKPRALMKAPLRGNNVDELEIRTFIVQFFYGATLNDNNDYVWTAPSSASGHRFSYRINYAISGKFELEPESIEMRIPKQILRDRDGEYADYYEMSIPTKKEVDDGEEIDMDINYAYYENGDEIVIYNFREVYTGENGYIELSYLTSKSTFNYVDYDGDDETTQDKSGDFYATIKVTGNGKTVTEESEYFNVYIDTNATIQSTDKRFPTKYNEWQSEWGNEPTWEDGSDGYYYLLWEIRSVINVPTQPYNFSIEDTLITEPGDFVAYRFSGQSQFSDINYAENQTIGGYRYDYVLTRHPKSCWDTLDHWEITNSEIATVDPIDQVDDDTIDNSMRTFVWNKPQFIHPNGWFDSFKRADRSYYSYHGLDYLEMIAGEYSRYDLEDLQEATVEYLDNLDYAVWTEGYPYIFTVEEGKDVDDPSNYWKVPVKYEVYDYIFYLYNEKKGIIDPNVGTDNETYGIPIPEYINNRLTANDFQIDSLAFGTRGYQDAYFDEDEQAFIPKNVVYDDNDILYFYAIFGEDSSDYKLVTTYNLKTREKWFDENYVSSLSNYKINFKDNCIGYKVITYSKHYHTRIDLVPNIRLKRSEKVLKVIAPIVSGGIEYADAVGILNSETANYFSYDSVNDNYDTKILTRSESASDYIRRSERFSHISKEIVATSNVPRKKRYSVNWKIKMDEEYTVVEDERKYIEQKSGVFYDYLPAGAILNSNSVAVENEKGFISEANYSYTLTENYNDSGRALLTVYIDEPGHFYRLYYETYHHWDAIKDWGNNVYNPVAYETGNDDLAPFNKSGHRENNLYIVQNQFTDIIDNSDINKFIFADTSYDISLITASAANLHKKVKDLNDGDYSYDTWTRTDGNYSYRIRYQNTFNTKSKDLIFFDYLESYPVYDEETQTTKVSDWHGTIESIDVSQLVSSGINPVIYYSTLDDLIYSEHHDIEDSDVWLVLDDTVDYSTIKAIAIDAREKSDGSDFILQEGDSLSIVVNMKAPETVVFSGTGYPETYNNIYLYDTTIDENGYEVGFFIHQDYTTIKLKVVNDIRINKVNEENTEQAVPDITFRLIGKSAYGNDVDILKQTNRNGVLIFKDIEMGEYILYEYESTDDWLEDHTEHYVKIDENRNVWIDGRMLDILEYYQITNKPRIHGDLRLQKRKEGDTTKYIQYASLVKKKEVGDTVTIDDIVYEVVEKRDDRAILRIKSPEFYYPVLEDDGNDIASGTEEYDYCDWRITSGGELLIGNPEKQQHIYRIPWSEYVNNIKAIRFVGPVTSHGNNIRFIVSTETWWGGSEPGQSIISIDFTNLTTEDLTSLDRMFYDSPIQYINWGDTFDTSKVVNMDYMFLRTNNLQYINLTSFNTSSLETMLSGFYGTNATVIDLSSFDTNALKYVNWMFNYCDQLNTVYVGNGWALSSVEELSSYSITYMFTDSTNLPNYDPDNTTIDKAYVGTGGYLSQYLEIPFENREVQGIENTTFILSGTSDYGTTYNLIEITDENGYLSFENIEKGLYELREIIANDEYIINKTVWTVRIDSGSAIVSEPSDPDKRDRLSQVEYYDDTNLVFDELRYTDFSLRKVDSDNPDIWLQGAEFRLTGTSALGTEYDVSVTSDKNGRVEFTNIEKGSYILTETMAPRSVDESGQLGGNRNYIDDERQYIVTVGDAGHVTIKGLKTNIYGDFVFPNDRAYDGKIVVMKKWDDGLTGSDTYKRPTPVLHLLSNDPSTLERYHIIYDANGGYFDDDSLRNYVLYNFDDEIIEGREKEVAFLHHPFEGWFLDRECTIPFEFSEENRNIVVYAKWGPNPPLMSYAVSVFDIGMDENKEGKPMGLTFGPAFGDDYSKSYKAHTVDDDNHIVGDDAGVTADGNAYRCVHYDDWETIVEWNNEDPYVYWQCMLNGCSHGVPIVFSDLFVNRKYKYTGNDEGDGWCTLDSEFNEYTDHWGKNESITFKGGWGSSRMRALYNGVDDDETDDGIVTDLVYGSYPQLETALFVDDNTLFAGLPQILQDNIGLRRTDYMYAKYKYATVYDKLFMLTKSNIDGSYNGEGPRYRKFSIPDIKINNDPRLYSYSESTVYVGYYSHRTSMTLITYYYYYESDVWVKNSGGGLSYTFRNEYVDEFSLCFALDTVYFDTHPVRGANTNTTNANSTRNTKANNTNSLRNGSGDEPIETIASGNFNGLSWYITTSGHLYLGETGIEQHIYFNDYTIPAWPWKEYSNQINRVKFDGKVYGSGSMYGMFSDMNLDVLDLTNFDTENVTSLDSFLQNTSADTVHGLNSLDTRNVTNMARTFMNFNHNAIDLSNWNTKNVSNMASMFNGCKALVIDGINKFNTLNVYYFTGMFANTIAESIDVSSFRTTRYDVDMREMFYNSKTKKIDLGDFASSDLTTSTYYYSDMFTNSAVEKLVISPHLRLMNYSRSSSCEYYKMKWVKTKNADGSRTNNHNQYTWSSMVNLNNTTSNPTIGGTWIRTDSIYYVMLDDGTIEYISERGINANNHFEMLDDTTWKYTFDVFDDTLQYYLYEEFIDDYESDAMAPNYIEVNNDEINYVTTITNKKEKDRGNLKISKSVEGEPDEDRTFEFTITLSKIDWISDFEQGELYSGTKIFSNIVFVNGVAKVYLKNNESITIEDIFTGTTYTVVEKPVDNYTTTSENSEGSISKGETSEVTFTNTYIPPVYAPVDITIKKNVTGNYTQTSEFSMYAVFTDLTPNKTYYLSNDDSFVSDDTGNATVLFTISTNETIKFLNLPIGTKYSIVEPGGAYIGSYTIVDKNGGSLLVQTDGKNYYENQSLSTETETVNEGEDVIITFTNEVNVFTNLKLSKKVTRYESTLNDFEFVIEITNLKPNTVYDSTLGRLESDEDGTINRSITLSEDKSVEFYNLPIGAKYTITENDYFASGFVTEITSNNDDDIINESSISGTLTTDSNIEIEYNNCEIGLKGIKIWEDGGLEHDNEKQVKLILKRYSETTDEEIVDESEYTLTWEDNKFFYTKLKKFDEHNNEYTYFIEEENISNYSSDISYDKEKDEYTIINTKDKGEFTITKTVTGKKIDINKSFKFTITLRNSDGELLSGVFSGIEFVDGVATIELKHDESITIETYAGVSYEVQEQDYRKEKYRTYYENNKGVISKEKTIICKYVNVLEDEEKPPYTPPKTGK